MFFRQIGAFLVIFLLAGFAAAQEEIVVRPQSQLRPDSRLVGSVVVAVRGLNGVPQGATDLLRDVLRTTLYEEGFQVQGAITPLAARTVLRIMGLDPDEVRIPVPEVAEFSGEPNSLLVVSLTYNLEQTARGSRITLPGVRVGGGDGHMTVKVSMTGGLYTRNGMLISTFRPQEQIVRLQTQGQVELDVLVRRWFGSFFGNALTYEQRANRSPESELQRLFRVFALTAARELKQQR
jgi:hypothetical protein